MKVLENNEVAYLIQFTDEVMSIYDADYEGVLPRQIEDMAKNVYAILRDTPEECGENGEE